MADKDVTNDSTLTSNTTPATTDRLLLVDDGTTSLQDITLANMLKVLNGLTADGSPDTAADYLLAYDTDAGAVKKVLMNLVGGSTGKGRFEILGSTVPTTVGAPLGVTAGASTPAESIGHFNFASGSATYIELVGRLIGYNGGGLTINFEVLRTSAAAGETYIFEAGIRRLNTGTEDTGAAHTYDYNAVTVTVPAGPPAAGIPMAGVITFTDGADMDSLADNEAAIIYFRRNGGTAADIGRVLTTITVRET